MPTTNAPNTSQVNLAEVDLLDPQLYSHGEPYAVWDVMRREAPVHWQQVNEELGFWSITKHRDAIQVLKDYNTFTSEQGSLVN
ncbi:cytochrome P450, partial [Bacillus subtilis]